MILRVGQSPQRQARDDIQVSVMGGMRCRRRRTGAVGKPGGPPRRILHRPDHRPEHRPTPVRFESMISESGDTIYACRIG
jgi:hypothetical protein